MQGNGTYMDKHCAILDSTNNFMCKITQDMCKITRNLYEDA